MNDFQKVYDGVGNASFDRLWNGVKDDLRYRDSPEYIKMTKEFTELLATVQNPSLRCAIEDAAFDFTSLAMYQGFILGFQEAVKLIIVESKK